MIGVDTNVLLRYLVQDDPEQSALATRFLERHCKKQNPGHITLIVLCELVWVLCRGYGQSRAQAAAVIRRLLETIEFDIEKPRLVRLALSDYENGKADLSDYLIARIGEEAGVPYTITFDRQAAAHPLFKLLAPG